ncbi:MAG: hypothetical protein K9L17_05565 [Clostridiales bacterium]|nr:hypothetical protein [Clostridiales bacterium]MCF8022139.1 hypothetical protein [Clostridiales bacterium]
MANTHQALLKSDFPYGANMNEPDISQPSVMIKIYCKEQYFFNIESGQAENLNLTYKVTLSSPRQAFANDDGH